ncbi:hypothetical protein ACSBR1_000358 [Camellia fascicularis]
MVPIQLFSLHMENVFKYAVVVMQPVRHIVLDEFYTLNGSDYQNGTRGGPLWTQQHGPVRLRTGQKSCSIFYGVLSRYDFTFIGSSK